MKICFFHHHFVASFAYLWYVYVVTDGVNCSLPDNDEYTLWIWVVLTALRLVKPFKGFDSFLIK